MCTRMRTWKSIWNISLEFGDWHLTKLWILLCSLCFLFALLEYTFFYHENGNKPWSKSWLQHLLSLFRFSERRGSTWLLGARSGHHTVPSVLQNLHSSHVQAPLQGLWSGCVWSLLHTHQACPLQRLGPPGQSVWRLPCPHRRSLRSPQTGKKHSECSFSKNTVNPDCTAPVERRRIYSAALISRTGISRDVMGLKLTVVLYQC